MRRKRGAVAPHPIVRRAGAQPHAGGDHPHAARAVAKLGVEDTGRISRRRRDARDLDERSRRSRTSRAAAGGDSDTVSVVQRETPRFVRSIGGRGVRKGSASRSSSGRSVRSSARRDDDAARQYARFGEPRC